jgi:hypothetical protein
MSCVSVAGIARLCGPNPGGLKTKIYLARIVDILTLPAATNKVVSTDIVMKTGKSMVAWDIELDSGNITVETEGSISNPSLKAGAVFKVARNAPGIDAAIDGAIGQDLLILIPENSGNVRIIGNLDKGAFIGYKGATGLKSADFAGKDLTVTWEGLFESPNYYTGNVPLTAGA